MQHWVCERASISQRQIHKPTGLRLWWAMTPVYTVEPRLLSITSSVHVLVDLYRSRRRSSTSVRRARTGLGSARHTPRGSRSGRARLPVMR